MIKIQVIQYISNRIKTQFADKSQFIIFNNFCCSLLSNSENLELQAYKSLLGTLETIQNYKIEETEWFLSMSFIDHAPYISKQNYELLGHPIFQRFQEHCKNKKSKLIKNYLEAIFAFIQSDFEIDYQKHNYERLQKYGIFTSLNFCISNRSPEVKKQLAEIGSTLIANFE